MTFFPRILIEFNDILKINNLATNDIEINLRKKLDKKKKKTKNKKLELEDSFHGRSPESRSPNY